MRLRCGYQDSTTPGLTQARSNSPSRSAGRGSHSCSCTASRRPTLHGGGSRRFSRTITASSVLTCVGTATATSRPVTAANVRTRSAPWPPTWWSLMRGLGHDEFAVVGHDRGALVGFRAGLDHPDAVRRLGVLGVIPSVDMWDAMSDIAGVLRRTAYLTAASTDEAIHAICEDCRAGAFVDPAHDAEDREHQRRLGMPVLAIWEDPARPSCPSTRRRYGRSGHQTCGPASSSAVTSCPRRPRSRSPRRYASSCADCSLRGGSSRRARSVGILSL